MKMSSVGLLALVMCVLLADLSRAHAWNPRATRYNAKEGMGSGVYDCDMTFLGELCFERARCGPASLASPDQLVECHGIVAKCADWATLQTRVIEEKPTTILHIGEDTVFLKGWDDDRVAQATALANFCIAQK